MIHKLVELTEKAQHKPRRKIAVAAAEDEPVLKSLKSGRRRTGAKIAQSSYAEWYRQPCAGWRQK